MKAEIHSYPFEDLFEKTVFTEMAQLNRGQIWLIIFKKKSNMKVGFYSLKAFQHHACDMIKQKRENKKHCHTTHLIQRLTTENIKEKSILKAAFLHCLSESINKMQIREWYTKEKSLKSRANMTSGIMHNIGITFFKYMLESAYTPTSLGQGFGKQQWNKLLTYTPEAKCFPNLIHLLSHLCASHTLNFHSCQRQ